MEAGQSEITKGEASTPRQEYSRRQQFYRARAAQQARLFQRIANMRAVVVVLACLFAWMASGGDRNGSYGLALCILLFPLLVIWQNGWVHRARLRAEQAARYYDRALARLDDRWMGTGRTGVKYLNEDHPYALDLDLFGSGSLFELLCTAHTSRGEATLADWLRYPGVADRVRARQQAILELRDRLELREEIALLAGGVPPGTDLDALVAWAEAPPILAVQGGWLAAVALAVLAVLTLGGWLLALLPLTPFLVVLGLESGFALWLRSRVLRVIDPVEKRANDLALFAGILGRIERERFTTPHLRELQASLRGDGLAGRRSFSRDPAGSADGVAQEDIAQPTMPSALPAGSRLNDQADSERPISGLPPSERIARLGRLIDWLNARMNQLFAPFALMLLWTTQHAFAIEAWRTAAGALIGRWLAAVGEFEALCALSAYTYEHPDDPFPEIVAGAANYEAEALGHPLLPRARCVCNDVRLGGDLRLLVVSGSNMSGKSTLLRTVGINAVLALAGAPVRAARLRLSPLQIGATLRIQDSLQAGRSRFFAEVTRVRQLVELAKGSPPLLFLLDELFQGTNSHDRRIGAEAVVRTLVDHGAIGLITTHDLALTEIADLLGPRAANVHFEDQFEAGTMTFDYRMRPGVVTKSNALALMRSVGIDV
jgi:hypothetical protein